MGGLGRRSCPVSYTHLDVYKRQMYLLADDLLDQWQTRNSSSVFFEKVRAVSYTHLSGFTILKKYKPFTLCMKQG